MATVTGVISGLQQIGNAIFGSDVLTLGSVSFQNFEVPESIKWGGAQSTTVHKLPGGGRVIDSMGRDDSTLDWSGRFLGPNATQRAQLLDGMRISGQPFPLLFGQFSYIVVISKFDATYKYASLIPYSISCIVLTQRPAASSGGLVQQITNAISNATGINIPAVLGTVTSAVSTVQGIAGAIGTITGGSPSSLALLNGIGAVQGYIGAASSIAGTGLSLSGSLLGAASSGLSVSLPSLSIGLPNLSGLSSTFSGLSNSIAGSLTASLPSLSSSFANLGTTLSAGLPSLTSFGSTLSSGLAGFSNTLTSDLSAISPTALVSAINTAGMSLQAAVPLQQISAQLGAAASGLTTNLNNAFSNISFHP